MTSYAYNESQLKRTPNLYSGLIDAVHVTAPSAQYKENYDRIRWDDAPPSRVSEICIFCDKRECECGE